MNDEEQETQNSLAPAPMKQAPAQDTAPSPKKEIVNVPIPASSKGFVLTDNQPEAKKGFHFPDKILRIQTPLFFAIITMIAVVAVIVFVTVQNSNEGLLFETTQLNEDELAQIGAVTATQSDNGTKLVIDADSTFERSLLIKDSVEIVGGLTVGGPINIPDLQVSTGSLDLENATVSGNFQVQGNGSFAGSLSAGSLNIAGNANIAGDLIAQSLSISNFNLLGDFTLSAHLRTTGAAPSISSGGSIGSGGTTSLNGNDISGTITINTGTGSATGTLASINFAKAYASPPQVIITPTTASAATSGYYVTRTATGFTVRAASNPADSSTLQFDYIIVE